jgi:vancomycin resistance protein YoaR
MSLYPAVRHAARPPRTFRAPQILTVLVGGLALFIAFSFALAIVYSLHYAGRIYPGVSVGGVDLSNLTPGEAEDRLAQNLPYPQTGKIVFEDGDQIWTATPAELGLFFDMQDSSLAAYRLGRGGNPFSRWIDQISTWYSGREISPLLIYDERVAQRYLEGIESQVNKPVVEASLQVNGLDVVVVPGQIGRTLDMGATLASLEDQMRNLSDGIVPLVIHESPPTILDASQQAEVARGILSAPLTIKLPNAGESDPLPWIIPQEQLAGMLAIERVQSPEGARYQVGLDDQKLTDYVSALAANVNRYPQNARFTFNDDTHKLEVIQPGVIGRTLDIGTSVGQIKQQVLGGQHSVDLTVTTTPPQIGDDATGEQLGITELVSSYTSYFRGSTQERMQNIQIAAANFHGLMVPPGATFSMADVMGNVSLDTGYAEAWIIFGGRTIKGVGGGVCQVSTTLFRTAFFGGFPIVQRYPHAYRVSYYEQTRTGTNSDLAGLDATVFVPLVDFKFQNDTPYWLLMETYFNAASHSLTWKFYSTKDGRSVEWDSSGLQNVTDPPDPVYEENPDLAEGEIKQVDWAVEGADVVVTRTVNRDGQVLYSDQFSTHYLPWGDIYQYGPGTKLPKKKKVFTTGAVWVNWAAIS